MAQWGSGFTAWTKSGNFSASWIKKTGTPVFVRFSTVQGGAGSADTVRDIRGFATKFYTDEGSGFTAWTKSGNFSASWIKKTGVLLPTRSKIPSSIQDALKFPDFVHAVKPEPHWAIPQGQSAHDTFWDWIKKTGVLLPTRSKIPSSV
jgi:catalase